MYGLSKRSKILTLINFYTARNLILYIPEKKKKKKNKKKKKKKENIVNFFLQNPYKFFFEFFLSQVSDLVKWCK